MKMATSGKTRNNDWFGLSFRTKVPMSWTVTVETLGWEVWKISITTPNRITSSLILKKTGDRPTAFVEKKSFHRNEWRLYTNDLSIEDEE